MESRLIWLCKLWLLPTDQKMWEMICVWNTKTSSSSQPVFYFAFSTEPNVLDSFLFLKILFKSTMLHQMNHDGIGQYLSNDLTVNDIHTQSNPLSFITVYATRAASQVIFHQNKNCIKQNPDAEIEILYLWICNDLLGSHHVNFLIRSWCLIWPLFHNVSHVSWLECALQAHYREDKQNRYVSEESAAEMAQFPFRNYSYLSR